MSVYCDPTKQAVGVLMSCPLMETDITPLCFGSIHIVFAMDTRLIPDSMSSKDQFVKDETTIGTMPLTQMSIDTGDSDPISQKPYPVAMKHYQWVKEEIDKLLEAGVIRNSQSSWSAPIIVVPKGDGGKCLVIDYRALNKVTRKFVWPMPKVKIFSHNLMVQSKQHSHHHLASMSMSKYPLDWPKHLHISRN